MRPWKRWLELPDFPEAGRLGRVTVGSVELKARPDPDSQTLGTLYEDAVLPWVREVSGARPAFIFNNQRWVETPQGYIYGPYLQPVYDRRNQPVRDLPASSRGAGMWAEVTVPYADAALVRAPSSNSWVEAKLDQGLPLRVYYSQNFWIDEIRRDEQGRTLYRVNPNYYGGVDMLWVEAEAFRPITSDELTPINPEATSKRIEVDVTHQTLSCFEGNAEVYFCRVSTGAKFDMFGNVVDKWSTPVGVHHVTRKYISLQMSGGTTGAGYDLPGIGWTSIFATGGVAIHSTFWHNNFGDPVSHGCVNATPEDAKWIFRWTMPNVVYDPGMVDVTLSGDESTLVEVYEG
jgi:lipoprotein-anchoring transpeptidase ErfK/SrfK